jgi:DNA-binding NarL/FixJ family response regulator
LCTHQQTEQLVKAATETVQGTNVPLLVVTDERLSDLQPFFREMLHSGVCGFVSTIDTEFRTLVAAIEFILNGGVFVPPEFFTQGPPYTDESKKSQRALDKLTKRQIDVFTKLREGKENKQIASELGMSASTVKSHVRDIMRTMGARNRTEAVVKARSGRIPER